MCESKPSYDRHGDGRASGFERSETRARRPVSVSSDHAHAIKFIVSTLVVAILLAAFDVNRSPAHSLGATSSTPMPGTSVGARQDTTAEEAVRTTFERYRKALLERDGELASRAVDKKTLEAYQGYLDLARTVDRSELDDLDLLAKLMVLRLRHELDAAKLAAATGRGVFAMAVENGWISDNSVRDAAIAKIAVDHTSASASIRRNPKVPLFFFFKEGDSWKFALWKLFPVVEPVLRTLMAASGETDEVAYVVALIEAVSPRKFDRALLHGPPAGVPQSSKTRLKRKRFAVPSRLHVRIR